MKALKITGILFFILSVLNACVEENLHIRSADKIAVKEFKTQNCIVVVIDGLRYTEGWGDSSHSYIPYLAGEMAGKGVINTSFYNLGDTYTSAGHSNITTGFYQSLNNSGEEIPDNPSFFQIWNQIKHNAQFSTWIITSKDKLFVLSDCKNTEWKGKFNPSANCGIDGLGFGSGYRDDSLTTVKAIEILNNYHPNLVLINFREPDFSAHSGNWDNYLKGIRQSDKNLHKIEQFLESNPFYKNTTTLFVTSDHGRHSEGIADGFVSHGDTCNGCRHLIFYASGPDFKSNCIISSQYEQIDLPVTIGKLMGFQIKGSSGKVMNDLFLRTRSN